MLSNVGLIQNLPSTISSKKIQDNKNIVLTAVKQRRFAFEYASEKLQSDKEIILNAIYGKDLAFYYNN